MRVSTHFKIKNGTLNLSSAFVKINYNNRKHVLDVLKVFGGIGLCSKVYNGAINYSNLTETYELIKFWFFTLAALCALYFVIEFLLLKIWLSKIAINDITKIIIEDLEIADDDFIVVTIYNQNNRKKTIALERNNKQLERFLQNIKQRNTKLKIQQL